jgi:hypothetical protein
VSYGMSAEMMEARRRCESSEPNVTCNQNKRRSSYSLSLIARNSISSKPHSI